MVGLFGMALPSESSEGSSLRRPRCRWSEIPFATIPSTAKGSLLGSPPVANGLHVGPRKPASEKRPCGWVNTMYGGTMPL